MAIAPENALASGDDAPALTFATLSGEELTLESFRGKYVLLDFWATWCGPCVAETPHLKAVFDAHGANEKFAMIGLSLDTQKSAPENYAKENGLEWIQGFLGDWGQTAVPATFGVTGIPAIMLIGPDGTIVENHLRGERILEVVNEALNAG
jgi:thiol-disulfide isomerase/thioredoxin